MTIAEFSRPFQVERLGREVKIFDLEANAAERAALAGRFRILSIDSLVARVQLSLVGGVGLVRLKGYFAADVVQACVLSLEPVPAHLEEDFELTYSTEAAPAGDEVVVELDDEEPPEPIVDGVIDLGEAVAEHLALALDPFPRAPGARFDEPAEVPTDNERSSPFAGLAAFKKK